MGNEYQVPALTGINVSQPLGRSDEVIIQQDWVLDAGVDIEFIDSKREIERLYLDNLIPQYFHDLGLASSSEQRCDLAYENLEPLFDQMASWMIMLDRSLIDARLIRDKNRPVNDPNSYYISYLHNFGYDRAGFSPYRGSAMGTYFGGNPISIRDALRTYRVPQPLQDFYENLYSHYGGLLDPESGLCKPRSGRCADLSPEVQDLVLDYLQAERLEDLVTVSISNRRRTVVLCNPDLGFSRGTFTHWGITDYAVTEDLGECLGQHILYCVMPDEFLKQPDPSAFPDEEFE